MRRLTLLLLAALMVLTGVGLHIIAYASPTYAAGFDTACGFPFDTDGNYNNDGYWGGPGYPGAVAFVTGADGAQHELDIDLAAYRLTENNNCYRGFYVSTWFRNHEAGYQHPVLNAYTGYNGGGQVRGPWTFNHDTYWDWGNYVWTGGPADVTCETCGTLGPWGSYTVAVTLPNARVQNMDFGISTGYGRKAETSLSHVYDGCVGGCNFDITSYPGSGWFLRISEP